MIMAGKSAGNHFFAHVRSETQSCSEIRPDTTVNVWREKMSSIEDKTCAVFDVVFLLEFVGI